MTLPEWCQTHSLKDFMELMEQDLGHTGPKERTMDVLTDELAGKPINEALEGLSNLQAEEAAKAGVPFELTGVAQDVDFCEVPVESTVH